MRDHPATVSSVTEARRGPAPPGSEPPTRPQLEFRPPPSGVVVPRPALVTASCALWFTAAVAAVAAVLLPFAGLGDFQTDLRAVVDRDYPSESAGTRDRVVTMATAVLVGGGIAIGLLQAGFAASMGAGRGGARIVLVLVLAPAALHALVMLGVAPASSAVLLGLSLALASVAAVLMLLPAAGAWFARQRG